MGSREKYFSLNSADKGVDNIGFTQPAGVINSVARYGAGKWAKYALVTASAAHNLTRGQQVNVTGTTDYDGPSIVIAVPTTTTFVIKKGFTVTKTGAWDVKIAEGHWDAFIVVGADIPAANIALEFWNGNKEGGADSTVVFTKDQRYVFPGGIKRVTITTAGDIKLIRSAVPRPGGGSFAKAPLVFGYNPAGGVGAQVGASIDIIGDNFDPQNNNVVTFFNGVIGYPTHSNEQIITVPVPVGAATGVINVKKTGGFSVNGPSFTVLP